METAPTVRDPARLGELHASGLLESGTTENFDRLTRLAEQLLEVPVALVSLVDRERQVFASQVGLDEPWAGRGETPLSHSFCQYAVATGERLVIPDARSHEWVRENPAVEELDVAAYAGSPLETAAGNVLGTLCVIDHEPRDWMDWELEVLSDLAALAITEIDFRIRSSHLREVADHVAGLTDPIERLDDAVTSLANIADRAGDPRVERLASLSRGRLQGLRASTTSVLHALRDLAPDLAHAHTRDVNLGERLLRAVRLVSVAAPDAELRVEVRHRPLTVDADPHACERRLARLLGAVLDQAGGALVDVHADRDGDHAVVRVACAQGMPVSELTRVATLAHAVAAGPTDAEASLSTAAGTSVAQLPAGRARTGPEGTVVTARVPLRTRAGDVADERD